LGFSPRPSLIATYPTTGPALALSKGLDRDRPPAAPVAARTPLSLAASAVLLAAVVLPLLARR